MFAHLSVYFGDYMTMFTFQGCTIHWEKSMNLTVKTIRKKQKHKARGAVRTITKQVPNDSFFNFFNPPQINEEDKDKEDEETQGVSYLTESA